MGRTNNDGEGVDRDGELESDLGAAPEAAGAEASDSDDVDEEYEDELAVGNPLRWPSDFWAAAVKEATAMEFGHFRNELGYYFVRGGVEVMFTPLEVIQKDPQGAARSVLAALRSIK